MRKLKFDRKNGLMVLRPESSTDLYILMNIIENGDKLICKTSRRIRRSSGGENRSGESSERVTMTIGIEVEDFKFQEAITNRLRVKGKIFQGPEKYVSIGGYHTLNIEPNTIITLIKTEWSDYHLQLLKEAEEAQKKPKICLIAIDEQECTIGILDNFRLTLIGNIKSKQRGKKSPLKKRDEKVKNYFDRIWKIIQHDVLPLTNYLVIGGPGFTKERLATFFKNNNTKTELNIIVTISVSSGSRVGVSELLKSSAVDKIGQDFRVLEESKLIDKFITKLSRGDSDISYGLAGIKKIASSGAIETVIAIDKIVHEDKISNDFSAKQVLKEIEKARGKVILVPSNSENADKLQTFGGMIAFLRYSMNW